MGQFDSHGIFFGTQSGSVFGRGHQAEGREEAAARLPRILSVESGSWS